MKTIYKFFLTVVLISCFFFAGELYPSPLLPTVIKPRNTAKEGEPFSFAVAGDSQPQGESGEQPEVLKKIIEEINKSGAAFLVHLGDKIHGSKDINIVRRQYGEYQDVIAKLKIPVYTVVGNHDVSGVKENEELHKKTGPLYYSFEHKNCLFIVLNTEFVGSEGAIKGKQLSWLESELEKGVGYRYIFVFLHRPLYSVLISGRSHEQFYSEGDRDILSALLKKYNVSAVFAGHEHLYNSGIYNGLRQFTSGGGGGSFHFAPTFPHYLIVEVTGKTATVTPVPIFIK